MVKKLLKQEYKYYSRILVFVLPILLFFGICMRIIQLVHFEHIVYYLMVFGAVALLAISSAAAILIVNILGVVRYYKNLYSSEGYLTFTLPVTHHQIIISKLIAHCIVNFITILAVLIAWIIGFMDFSFMGEIVDAFSIFFQQNEALSPIINLIFILIEIILICLVSGVSTPLLYYACISIGQTAKKNRILLAIGVYYIYTIIVQVISTVFSVVFSLLSVSGVLDSLLIRISENPFPAIHIFMSLIIIGSALLGGIYYYINYRMMNTRLNLE